MPQSRADGPGFRRRYESLLWGMMDLLGVTESIERKVTAAVVLQFLATVGVFVIPFLFSGLLWYGLAGLLFAAASVALVNTILIVRRDFTGPLLELEAAASEIAAGNLDVEMRQSEQKDEIGSLVDSFHDMQTYLRTVSGQAEALAAQEFDDPILEEDIPGEFGAAIDRMAANLETYTEDLEAMSERRKQQSEQLEELVTAVSDATDRAQDGDLRATIDWAELDVEGDRYETLIEQYNDLIRTTGETIGTVRTFATEVSAASADLESTMADVAEGSQTVASSVGDISDNATEQATKLQAVTEEMNTLSATVEEIAAAADDAAETAQTATERSTDGRDAAETAIDELDSLERRITETATAVEDLAAQVEAIDDIVAVIEEVAGETDVLALNASIEAAEADENGDGFAVVAEEVKSLAEQTRKQAATISQRIDDVQTAATETATDVRAMESHVGESVETIEQTLRSFDGIVEEVRAVDRTVQEISDATDEQASSSQEISAMVEDVAEIGEETKADAGAAAETADQQAVALSSVTETVESLSTQSEQLQTILDGFTLPQSRDAGVKTESTATS